MTKTEEKALSVSQRHEQKILGWATTELARHELLERGDGLWLCQEPGTFNRHFWVFIHPESGTIHFWGDLCSMSMSLASRGVRDPRHLVRWLSASGLTSLSYFKEKVQTPPTHAGRAALDEWSMDVAKESLADARKDAEDYGYSVMRLSEVEHALMEADQYGGVVAQAKWYEAWSEHLDECEPPPCTVISSQLLWQNGALRRFVELYQEKYGPIREDGRLPWKAKA